MPKNCPEVSAEQSSTEQLAVLGVTLLLTLENMHRSLPGRTF